MKLDERQVDETESCLNSAPEGTTVPHLREVFCATCNNSACQWSMATKLAWMSRMTRLETGRQHRDERPAGFNGIQNPGFEVASKNRQWAVANNLKDTSETAAAPVKESLQLSDNILPSMVLEESKLGETAVALKQAKEVEAATQEATSQDKLSPYTYEGVTSLDQSGHFDHHKAQAKPVPSQILLDKAPAQSPWAAGSAPTAQKKKKVYRIQDGKPSS